MTRFALSALLLVATSVASVAADPAPDAFAVNRMLGRGINLGNAFEAPEIGSWGMEIRPEYLDAIAEAGFDSIRVPIRWSAHADKQPPYKIDDEFFQLIDGIVDQALRLDLAVIINFHHYEELYAQPDAELARFAALWRQIADRYQGRPEKLIFEILNEPHAELSHEKWQQMFPELLAVIREKHPHRAVIIGPGQWNNVSKLPELRLPENDRMLIGTFHYYNPFPFTHQRASWVEGSDRWKDIRWNATPEEIDAIEKDFDLAAQWSKRFNRPVYVGEFGAYGAADMTSRVKWTRAITEEANKRGFSSAYWEFGAGFGVYDRDANKWRDGLKNALLED